MSNAILLTEDQCIAIMAMIAFYSSPTWAERMPDTKAQAIHLAREMLKQVRDSAGDTDQTEGTRTP